MCYFHYYSNSFLYFFYVHIYINIYICFGRLTEKNPSFLIHMNNIHYWTMLQTIVSKYTAVAPGKTLRTKEVSVYSNSTKNANTWSWVDARCVATWGKIRPNTQGNVKERKKKVLLYSVVPYTWIGSIDSLPDGDKIAECLWDIKFILLLLSRLKMIV